LVFSPFQPQKKKLIPGSKCHSFDVKNFAFKANPAGKPKSFRWSDFKKPKMQKAQLIEFMAISLKAYPCKEMERAERLTGKKELRRFREIPSTIKLAIIDVTRT